MVTDYANRKPPATRKSRKKILLTIIILLIAGLMPLTMYYVQLRDLIHNNGKMLTTTTKKVKPSQQPQKADDDKLQFDFYTLLPTMVVPTPKAKTQIPMQQSKKIVYVLQVAALRNRKDAEKFRNQLIGMGYRAYTQSYQSSQHNTWHRVLAGPYISRNTAEKDQRKLHNKEHLDSLLLRLKL